MKIYLKSQKDNPQIDRKDLKMEIRSTEGVNKQRMAWVNMRRAGTRFPLGF